jgi:signal transduction histidine kinase
MFLSVRTTIFWNILVLMVIATGLISFVVFRITEQAMFNQRALSGEMLFSSIKSSLSHILALDPDLLIDPSPESAIQDLFRNFQETGVCRQIFFVDNKQTVIAHSDKNRTGQFLPDIDIMQAVRIKSLYKKTNKSMPDSEPQFVIAGPVEIKGRQAGFLKAVFPMSDVNQGIKRATKIIFVYILFDAVILIAFGTFLMSRYLANPIKKLIRLTEDISEGNLESESMFLSDRSEFGKLSTALKSMSEKIKEEKDKIQEQVLDLEKKNIQLQQAREEAIQAEKLASLGRLSAGIAHEVGNPLGIIMGYIHMLRNSEITVGKRDDYLNRMESEAERVKSIIQELLDYAHPSSMEIEKINLNDIIQSTYSLVSCQKEFKNIKAIFRLDDALPPLYANGKQIQQLIVNLVLNARDAMPGGGTLTFTTHLDRPGEEDKIIFIIADTGEGIPFENRNKIFDPFFTTKEQGKGTGLGLSNTLRIVELSGGKISFDSRPSEGTTFTLIFPAKTN